MGEEEAREFLRLTRTLAKLQVLDTSDQHRNDIAGILDRFRGSKLSYVDASSLTYIKKRRIKTVWSTDHHLGIGGAQVLPIG